MSLDANESNVPSIDNKNDSGMVASHAASLPMSNGGQNVTAIQPGQETSSPDNSYYDTKAFEQLVSNLKTNPETKALAEQTEAFIKSTRSSWTKKHQEYSGLIKDARQKIEAYDSFSQNPIDALQQYANKYGYSLSKVNGNNQQTTTDSAEWAPNTWDEVISRAKSDAVSEMMEKLKPILGNVQKLQASAIENQLDAIDPLWKRNEEKMIKLLKDHPTLVNDLPTLYELSVPREEREASATQKAISKMKINMDNAKISGPQTSVKTVVAKSIKSFNDAYEAAKEQLKKR